MSLDDLRKLLPATSQHHFFNYAATAPMLKPCADRMVEVIQEGLEPLSFHFEKWLAILESARKTVAKTVYASPEEIAFTTNTSSALSLIARSVNWNPIDRILYAADDFPSNRFIWENLGIQAKALEGRDFLEALKSQDLTNVKLVAVSAVSYLDGYQQQIAEIVRFCHARGILVAVDAIQAVGAISVNLQEWNCDFLACGGQKWLLGPVGTGFLYLNKNILPSLNVPLIGWATSRDAGNFDQKKLEFVDGARRFEPGLPDIAAIAGLASSLETFHSFGWEHIFERIATYSAHLRTEFSSMGYRIANDGNRQSGIVTLNLDSKDEADTLYQKCLQNKIILTHRKNQLRIATHATVSVKDLEKLLSVLKRQTVRAFVAPLRKKDTNQPSFEQKHALVTGASQGLGVALAHALAKRGYNLTLIGRDSERLQHVAQEIKDHYSIEVIPVALNLAQSADVEKWLTQHPNLTFDVVIHNAAWAEGECFVDARVDDFRQAIETNFISPIQITQKLLPSMLKKSHGFILNVVTSGARCALPFFTAYASSKAALWSWSEALSRELTGTGVHVMTFVPPRMSTSTNKRLGRKALAHFSPGNQTISSTNNLDQIAEKAIDALLQKQSFVAPLSVRIKIALNALFYKSITKKILHFWKA